MTTATIKKRFYCAIYTRKSTNEGLDQDFTTLDNQREAAESYITSQKSEGWIILPDRYDDGGYTGANTDRPALQKLIADIKEGKINCVVVYKVDRLSRSLLDFVQLLELFEKHGVTFVSVTQAFNTNNSMGRLTLNILLSFAQFEREIISERVKDKMGAARKKGRYVGGKPILGYDVDRANRKLIINKEEVKLVRKIFNLYLELKSFLKVAMALNDKGYRTKRYVTKSGKVMGGNKFKNTNIQLILQYVLYTGKVRYNGELYPGLHEAIIPEETFEKVQQIIANNRVERRNPTNTRNTGLLNNILRCKACNSIMFHTYTSKKGIRKYRYYVCMNAQKRGYKNCPGRSLNAQQIEDSVILSLLKIAADSELRKEALKDINKQIREEIEVFEKERKAFIKDGHALREKIDKIKELLKSPAGDKKALERELKTLTAKYDEYDRMATDIRVKGMSLYQKLVEDRELSDALIMNSPIWEKLFPQEKHKALKLILKEVEYDCGDGVPCTLHLTSGRGMVQGEARASALHQSADTQAIASGAGHVPPKSQTRVVHGKIGLTLNHNGIKFLYLLLHSRLQKDLK